MKNDTPYPWFTGNPEEFKFFESTIGGDRVVLVVPNDAKAVGAPWYECDKCYRSSVWRVADGAPVSLGYRKFLNFGEHPEFEPVDLHDKITAIEKIDGTCLICSKYRGEYIFRTRGTLDVHQMENGGEIDALAERYKIRELLDLYGEGRTIIFEWVTPTNILCVKYDRPELYLTGIVNHADYSYAKQEDVDAFAARHGLLRPRHHSFNVEDAMQMAMVVKETWVGAEGVVAYFGEDQQVLKKMKSDWHHRLHVARIMLGNPRKFTRFLLEAGALATVERADFERTIGEVLEYEVVEYYREKLDRIWNAHLEFMRNVARAEVFVRGAEDPHEIVEGLRENAYGGLKDTYLWMAFRKKPHRASFVLNEILKYYGGDADKDYSTED